MSIISPYYPKISYHFPSNIFRITVSTPHLVLGKGFD